MQDGQPYLAGTARPAVARISPATTVEAGTGGGGMVSMTTALGSVTVPVRVADMPGRVVWLPTHSAGCEVRSALAARHGSLVQLSAAG